MHHSMEVFGGRDFSAIAEQRAESEERLCSFAHRTDSIHPFDVSFILHSCK
jgi:hypothetical protein